MLDDYKNEKIVYKQMINALNNNLSHAYLFNINDNVYANDMILSFAVEILSIDSNNEKRIIKKRVLDSNYPDIKIINSMDNVIKKEQIDELQKLFLTKPIEGTKKVYIIYGADNLNLSSANTLLKFLEEPNDGIVGILVTNKILNVINTISSRCQIINFSKNRVEDFLNYNNISDNITLYKLRFVVWNDNSLENSEKYVEFLKKFIQFIQYYKNNGIKSLTKIKEYFFDNFVEKKDIIDFFECLILFYRDILNYKINKKVTFYDDYIDLVDEMSDKYEYNRLIKTLSKIIEKEQLIKNNINVNMLIDSLLIELEELC